MGRDFTPREHHQSDIRWGFSKQKLEGLYDPDCPMSKRFPNLSFLTNGFQKIYETGELDGWDEIEKKVAAVVEQDSRYAVSKEDDYIWQWYVGKLDPKFFYNTVNEAMFLKQATKRVKAASRLSKE